MSPGEPEFRGDRRPPFDARVCRENPSGRDVLLSAVLQSLTSFFPRKLVGDGCKQATKNHCWIREPMASKPSGAPFRQMTCF